ncbi:MAG: restriction endonuclease subunit S [Magnetococcales bacterium]|nr:restriction endonuclease subunit S [Magnetococcales bacterium]
MPRTDMAVVMGFPTLLPPLPEQRRLVDLLSRAEGIVRLRREAQKKTAELIPALFLEMFGDPATNPKEWELSRLGDEIVGFEGGHSPKAGEEGASPFRILKLSAVTGGVFKEVENKPAPKDYIPSYVQLVKVGDVLITRSNTSGLVGSVAIVRSVQDGILLSDLIWRIIFPDHCRINIEYVWALFQTKAILSSISKLAIGTSDSMKKLSKGRFKELIVPIPPEHLQRKFATKISNIESIQSQQITALAQAKAAFDALLDRIFHQEAA